MIENKELNIFFTDIQEEINSSLISLEGGATPEQLFTEYALSILAETGETENFQVSYDEKISKRGTEHKVNGYALYENYETLDLFITIYNSDGNIQTIPKSDADKATDRLTKFFRNSIYKDYVNEIEESSEIFDLAQTLANVKEVSEFLTRVNICLLTNGTIKSDAKKNTKVAGYSVFYRFIDIEYLYNLSEKSGVPIEIDFAKNGVSIPCIEDFSMNEDYQSYLAIIPGSALADIYEQYGPRLLEQNVRTFLQFTGKINKGIRKTIQEEPHMFLAFNNGIAATAEEIKLADLPDNKGKTITYVKDFQIVNGGQTTASVYHTWKKNKADISKIFVQLKLTVIKDREHFSEIVGRIAEYANTQNKVSVSDLSSNRENHVILEKLSRTIWGPPKLEESHQTRWFYERSRGQYRNEKSRFGITPSRRKQFEKQNPRSQMFTKELLAKFINSYREVYNGAKLVIGPHFVVRGSQKNYSQFLNYNFVQKPDSIFFEDGIALYILFKSCEKVYGVKPNALGDMRYIVVPYTIAYLGYITEYRIDLYKIWKQQGIDKEFNEILKRLMLSIEAFIKKNAPGSLYGEWAKKEECWTQIKTIKPIVGLDLLKKYLLSNTQLANRQKKSSEELNMNLTQDKQAKVYSYGVKFWNGVSVWGKETGKLNKYLRDIADTISSQIRKKQKISSKQLDKADEILDIILKNNKTEDQIKNLSYLSEPANTNINLNINKFHLVNKSQWEQALEVGIKVNKLKLLHKNVIKEYLSSKQLSANQIKVINDVYEIGKKFNIIQ